ncbi:SprT family zinc-dependent metalloprotease [Vibrio viridaestus]|uniref:Protein SprT n=1 Tax=Vibrio viridaestus TaxID=2487322 RepID=A0A3N9TG34_9VIBR|nr:SprT family zinc-dependent metalloprotease [Vibrio viridaestus]RQW62864.1 SprT family zinc-dependent metalloprotease [Vibrio viridaestus]
MNQETLLITATQALNQWLKIINNHFPKSMPCPDINFKLRGKSAGKAYLQLNEIRLNPVLFAENHQAFIDDVIPHELAHLVAYFYYGRVKPHGREWQYIMEQVLGVAAKTTHQFDVSSVAGKVFSYRCNCTTHQLSIRRHNNIQRGKALYSCRHCKCQLQWIKDE